MAVNLHLITLEQWFWHVWDHLWRLLAWNLVLFTVSLPLLIPEGAPLMMILWFLLIAGPLLTATVAWAWPMAQDRSPEFKDLLLCIRRVYVRAVLLHLFFVLVLGLLTLNIRFYLSDSGIAALGRTPRLLLAGTMLWFSVYALIIWMWAQVALGEDRPEGPRSLFSAVRQGARITLFHPLLSLAHFITLALFTYAMLRSQVGMILFWHTAAAVYVSTAVFEMYFASEAKEQEARAAAVAPAKPTSWRQILQDEAPGVHGQRPRRSLKEIFRPWDMSI